ncbi:MAG: phage tail tape measure protein [Clostridiales bacterium]|nr:phage tail tape measure protein [Clostridiales bacterium]
MASSRIAGIVVTIGADTTSLSTALKNVNSEIKSTQTQLKDIERLLKLDPSNVELLTQKQKLLTTAIEDTKTKLETLKTAAEQANEQLQNGDITQEQYDALQREIIATEQELEKLADQSAESNAALQKSSAVRSTLEDIGDKITSVGTSLTTKVTAPIVALGTAAVSTAATFESSMSQVQATMGITSDATSELNGQTVNTMDALSDLAKEMGSTTAFSASECAEALNYYDTQEMADTQLDNLSGQITILKSALEGLAISFGETLMPVIKKVVSAIQGFVDKLNSMDEGQRQTIVTIAAVVAAIGPLLVIIGTLIGTVGKAMTNFSNLGTSTLKVVNHVKTGTGAAGKLATAISGISAPVLAVVAVIAVLVAAFKTLWDNNEEFRTAIIEIWNNIKETVSGFIDGIKEWLEALGISFEGMGGIVETLKNVWMEFCNLLAPLFEGAFSAVATVLKTVLDVITGLLDVFIGIFTGNWE